MKHEDSSSGGWGGSWARAGNRHVTRWRGDLGAGSGEIGRATLVVLSGGDLAFAGVRVFFDVARPISRSAPDVAFLVERVVTWAGQRS